MEKLTAQLTTYKLFTSPFVVKIRVQFLLDIFNEIDGVLSMCFRKCFLENIMHHLIRTYKLITISLEKSRD